MLITIIITVQFFISYVLKGNSVAAKVLPSNPIPISLFNTHIPIEENIHKIYRIVEVWEILPIQKFSSRLLNSENGRVKIVTLRRFLAHLQIRTILLSTFPV